MSSISADDSVVLDYKKLLEEVEEIRNQDVGLESVQSISRVMSIAEELVDKVKKPREIGLDAKVLEISSAVVQQNAERFDSGFRPEEFADKLIKYLTLNDSESSQADALIWHRFKDKFSHLLPLAPRFDYILGTIDREKVQRKERQARKPQSRNEGTKEFVKALTDKSAIQDSDLGQQHILDYISRLLVKTYRRNGEKPISYFKFVLSPHSLEETCQNILHIAFLVRDSFLKIFTDEDGELMIIPIKPKKDEMGGLQKEEAKRQFVIQINYQDWEDLVDLYDIKEPAINLKNLQAHKSGKK